MARITILSLQIKLAALASENEALRKQVLDLQLDLSHANAQIAETDEKLGHMLATEYVAPAPAPAPECDVPAAEFPAEALSTRPAPAPAPAPAPKRAAYVMPAWQQERAENMARAKAAAIAMRCVVKA